MKEREVFVAKGIEKTIYEMKKVHFSIKLIEIIFIVILQSLVGIAVFFFTKEDREMKESKEVEWEAE
ncbi:MAG: hypothetical protein HXS48_15180 [Theionarchaea archaeon]|nr:hypothetical protein [Theionarchaea archaeon]